jgi:hypothetical protein
MSYGAIDFTPLFCISNSSEQSFLLRISRLLLAVFAIPTICYIDFPIILQLLLCGPPVMRFKEPSSGFRGLDAHASDCQTIDHRFRLFHGNLLHSLDVADPITESIDDLDVLMYGISFQTL